MVPSALRFAALALLAAAAALFAFPAARPGVDPARAEDRPATAPAPDLVPLKATATLASTSEEEADAPAPAADAPQKLQARERATAPAKPTQPKGYTVARVRAGRSVALHAQPGGSTIKRLGPRTEFGSTRVLAVVAKRGRWLGVSVPERPNGTLGWVDGRSDALDRGRVKVALRADLSARRVDLRVDGKLVKRMKVAIGRPGSPSPTGRFAITDKIPGNRYGPYYGCCILAMSAEQPNPPPGWKGGNRMAIHGTNSPGTIGAAASAGCLRGADRDLQTLMRRVPLGTPIFIRR